MDLFSILVPIAVVGFLIYLVWQQVVFHRNTRLAAHKLGLASTQSGNKIVYEGLYRGRSLKIETKAEGWGRTAQTRLHFTVSTHLPSHIFLKLKIRPNVKNLILVEGKGITAEQLFMIEGYPQQSLIACFEGQEEFKLKLTEGIKYLKSKSKPFIEIRDKYICLEHSNFNLQSEQIIWLFRY